MFDRLRPYKKLLAAGLLVMIPVIVISMTDRDGVGTDSSAPDRWLRGGMGWLRAAEAGVIGGVGNTWESLFTGDLSRENEKLRQEVARLREEKARLIGVLQENARLRELVGFERRHSEYGLVPARVVARDISPYFRVLNLKLEAKAKLKPGMPVVVAGGVVGQIHRVYGSFADVIVAADPRSRIDAISQRNRAHGVVQGLGNERNYKARIAYLRRQDEVREGDVMVTSGMGEVFPPELVIGTVSKVNRQERGLFQEATLEPAVDYSRLEEVFVVTDPN